MLLHLRLLLLCVLLTADLVGSFALLDLFGVCGGVFVSLIVISEVVVRCELDIGVVVDSLGAFD